MMIEVKVPSPGESISQVLLSRWLVADGDMVEKDAEIAEIDSDKATLSIYAAEDGMIKLIAAEGDTVDVGSVVCSIDTEKYTEKKPVIIDNLIPDQISSKIGEKQIVNKIDTEKNTDINVHISPLARKLMEENEISEDELLSKYKSIRISRKEINKISKKSQFTENAVFSREKESNKLTPLRMKLSERLVAVKNQTAMLTTFNEVNMSALLSIKKQYAEEFKGKYGVGIGFMSFFTKAVTEALKLYPNVNSMLDGDDLIIPSYADISIAVSAPKGLLVPVIRNAESMTIPEIEIRIKELATKARDNKISLDEMSGGTFTITNGGVFGSMMSTPILNPPQSAILGMHNIIERPVAINGEVKIQPMMYIALSYDHRVIDGRESVGFLVKVKEMIENPVKMLFNGNDAVKKLLEI